MIVNIRLGATNLERTLFGVGGEFVSLWRRRVETQMNGDVRETSGRRPDTGEGQRCAATGHTTLVIEWVRDGDVPVPADTAQVKQWRRTEQYVVGVKHVAC